MTLLRLNIAGVKEPEVVAKGEYQVKLVGVELRTSKSGGQYLNASVAVDAENAPLIFHVMMLPAGDEHDNLRLLNIKRFCNAFGISEDDGFEFDTENKMIGVKNLRASAFIDVEEDPEYGTRNVIKRWA